MIVKKTIGIAVHVDTREGMKKGVPILLGFFRKYGIKTSFFVPMGKDHTGWTIKRVFKRKGFLKKSGTGRIWSAAVSKKTLMYGLLLPGPQIAKENKALLHRIINEGHELGIHGHDHVYWHDHIKDFDRKKTEEETENLQAAHRPCGRIRPQSRCAHIFNRIWFCRGEGRGSLCARNKISE